MTSDDWPSFNAELSRKTSAQLALWMERLESGKITITTAICVVGALYDTTSGMIDSDLSHLIADVYKDLCETAKSQVRERSCQPR